MGSKSSSVPSAEQGTRWCATPSRDHTPVRVCAAHRLVAGRTRLQADQTLRRKASPGRATCSPARRQPAAPRRWGSRPGAWARPGQRAGRLARPLGSLPPRQLRHSRSSSSSENTWVATRKASRAQHHQRSTGPDSSAPVAHNARQPDRSPQSSTSRRPAISVVSRRVPPGPVDGGRHRSRHRRIARAGTRPPRPLDAPQPGQRTSPVSMLASHSCGELGCDRVVEDRAWLSRSRTRPATPCYGSGNASRFDYGGGCTWEGKEGNLFPREALHAGWIAPGPRRRHRVRGSPT